MLIIDLKDDVSKDTWTMEVACLPRKGDILYLDGDFTPPARKCRYTVKDVIHIFSEKPHSVLVTMIPASSN